MATEIRSGSRVGMGRCKRPLLSGSRFVGLWHDALT